MKNIILTLGFLVTAAAGCISDLGDPPPASALASLAPGGVMVKMPHQDEATDLVWRQVYGQRGAPPPVFWFTDSALNCSGGTGFIAKDGGCVFGVSYSDHVEIAWGGRLVGSGPNGVTPFAHELGHSADRADGGDGDVGHQGPYFLGGKSSEADLALDAAGY